MSYFRRMIPLRRAYKRAYLVLMAHWDSAKTGPHYPYYGPGWEEKRQRLAKRFGKAQAAWFTARDRFLESGKARKV